MRSASLNSFLFLILAAPSLSRLAAAGSADTGNTVIQASAGQVMATQNDTLARRQMEQAYTNLQSTQGAYDGVKDNAAISDKVIQEKKSKRDDALEQYDHAKALKAITERQLTDANSDLAAAQQAQQRGQQGGATADSNGPPAPLKDYYTTADPEVDSKGRTLRSFQTDNDYSGVVTSTPGTNSQNEQTWRNDYTGTRVNLSSTEVTDHGGGLLSATTLDSYGKPNAAYAISSDNGATWDYLSEAQAPAPASAPASGTYGQVLASNGEGNLSGAVAQIPSDVGQSFLNWWGSLFSPPASPPSKPSDSGQLKVGSLVSNDTSLDSLLAIQTSSKAKQKNPAVEPANQIVDLRNVLQ